MSELAIQMEGVDKAYRFFSLRNIRLALERGQIMGFIGATARASRRRSAS